MWDCLVNLIVIKKTHLNCGWEQSLNRGPELYKIYIYISYRNDRLNSSMLVLIHCLPIITVDVM